MSLRENGLRCRLLPHRTISVVSIPYVGDPLAFPGAYYRDTETARRRNRDTGRQTEGIGEKPFQCNDFASHEREIGRVSVCGRELSQEGINFANWEQRADTQPASGIQLFPKILTD